MIHSAETRAKLSKMRKGERNPFYGRKHTAAFRKAQSERTRAFNAKRQYEASPQTLVVPVDLVTIGYLAGMIDADGSIRFRKHKYPFVCIYNTYAPLLTWLYAMLGTGSIYKTTKGREQVQCWQITAARDVFALLMAVRPHLIVKAGDADVALHFLREKYEWASRPQ